MAAVICRHPFSSGSKTKCRYCAAGPFCSFVILASIFVIYCTGTPVTRGLSTTCKEPDIENGEIFRGKKNTYFPGDAITFLCDNVYNIIGEGTIKCMPDGAWSNNAPFCVEIECHQLQRIQDGSITPNPKTSKIGSTIIVACDEGFQLHGNDVLHCTINGTWTPEWMPYCKDVTNGTGRQDNPCQERLQHCENMISMIKIVTGSVSATTLLATIAYFLAVVLYRHRLSVKRKKETQAGYEIQKITSVPEANPLITCKTRRKKYYTDDQLKRRTY